MVLLIGATGRVGSAATRALVTVKRSSEFWFGALKNSPSRVLGSFCGGCFDTLDVVKPSTRLR